jgi:hypothetical protein
MSVPNIFIRELIGLGKVGVLGVGDLASPDSQMYPAQTPGPTGINDLHDPARSKGATLLMSHPAGIAKQTSQIKTKLAGAKAPALPLACAPDALPVPMPSPPLLSDTDYQAAANTLKCEVAAIKAVAAVESAGGGFLSDGRPKILFEAHIFGKLTQHVFDADYPSVSAPNWETGKKYYQRGSAEYSRLELAYPLNPSAALSSASWGKFQIMGFNFSSAGYADVLAFVRAMYESEEKHLDAFVSFLGSCKLDQAIRTKAWDTFAAGYNGANYKENNYDAKLAEAYVRFSPKVVASTKK